MELTQIPVLIPGAAEIPEFRRTEGSSDAFMLYGSFRPLGSRELAGSCSSAVVVRSKRAFSA